MQQDHSFDIKSLHQAYAQGLDLPSVLSEVYRRIEIVGDEGIFLHLIDREEVFSQASNLGAFNPDEKPLWGIPFVIKDNIDVADTPTSAACPEFSYTADRDAFVVDALRKAGAILIGKTNLDQFATGLVGTRTPHEAPKNAIDRAIVPGGSSSGSAIAVAHGIVSFSLGTDTAGSGRVPAALNNIVGLKPSLGALSNTGVVPACRSLDTISIFALTVEDAYIVYQAAAIYDSQDSFASPIRLTPLGLPAPRFRVGVPSLPTREFCGDDVQAAFFEQAIEKVRALGGEIVELDFSPFFEVAKLLYEGPWVAERYAAIGEFVNLKADAVHPVTRAIVEKAVDYSATDAFKAIYRLSDLKRLIEPDMSRIDLLCVPSIPTFYALSDLAKDPFGPNADLGTYTNFVNLLDMCALTVPMPARTDGRPGSITLLARREQDARIASIANALQIQNNIPLGATAWQMPKHSLLKNEAGPDEIALAVVGAHMSGLPLNGELTKLGARFLYAAKTSSIYKFYSLPGGPPFRPGLVQEENGAAIELEVWSLPESGFGTFIKGVPAPLCIGSLTLENGDQVKGFLCEHAGTQGALEITSLGGWRAYLSSLETSSQQHKETSHAKT